MAVLRQPGTRWLSVKIVVVFAVVVAVGAVLTVVALDRFSDEKAIAAVIGLVGTMLTASISAVGVLVDARKHEESESRLRFDSSLEGMKLLDREGDQGSAQFGRTAALFSLTNLGQIDFALPLLEELWSDDPESVSSSAGLWVIGKALSDSDTSLVEKRHAATLLERQSVQLGVDGFTELPGRLQATWDTSLELPVKIRLMSFLARAHMNGPLDSTRNLESLVVPLHQAASLDDKRTAKNAAALLDPLMRRIAQFRPTLIHSGTSFNHQGQGRVGQVRQKFFPTAAPWTVKFGTPDLARITARGAVEAPRSTRLKGIEDEYLEWIYGPVTDMLESQLQRSPPRPPSPQRNVERPPPPPPAPPPRKGPQAGE